MKRPCLDCGVLTTGTRCARHRRAREKARRLRTTAERGYGAEHQALRDYWAPLVAAGVVRCWRCDRLIRPHAEWHLGHDDFDRTRYRGPEHVRCNDRAAGRKSHGLPVLDDHGD